ncbi:MAG: zf-HC2 domain-containing protein [Desulfobacterales bacterium]|nr:zf-HC2 domain-containing protein [Desulfobacterales bacterium]
MVCRTETALLYWSGELSPEQEKMFEHHLNTCQECSRMLQEFQTVTRAIQSLPVLKTEKDLLNNALNKVNLSKKKRYYVLVPALSFATVIIFLILNLYVNIPLFDKQNSVTGTKKQPDIMTFHAQNIECRISKASRQIERIRKKRNAFPNKSVFFKRPVNTDEKIMTIRSDIKRLKDCLLVSCEFSSRPKRYKYPLKGQQDDVISDS